MPDEDLLALAETGTLQENLDGEVLRMLADPKARALPEDFADSWLGLSKLKNASGDEAVR